MRKYPACKVFLKFDARTQYKIALVNYIANPLILVLSSSIKNYSDKLLVSSAYLIDHIYKYHRHGFSWRNLDYTPELLDVVNFV